MALPIQAHADAFLALLAAASGSPALAVYDGEVPNSPAPAYALVYFYIETPDGLTAPDKVSFTWNSDVINGRGYVHCVGGSALAARAVAGRVRSALLNVTPVISGRACFPIRWLEGQPPSRDEATLVPVFDQVDVYGWTSIPG
jgi:hypothetical protein